MVKEEDIVEIFMDTVKEESWKEFHCPKIKGKEPMQAPAPKKGFFTKERYIQSSTTLPKGRRFISEYEVKQMIKDGAAEITIPANAIISPLAQEIIDEKSIRVKRV